MKDFTIQEAAQEAAANFPGIPPEVTQHICEYIMGRLVEELKDNKHRISMRYAEIHTIYYDIRPDEVRAALADLDESRVLTEEESFLTAIERRNAHPYIPREVNWLHRRYRRAHFEGPGPHDLYPEAHSQGSSGDVCGPIPEVIP